MQHELTRITAHSGCDHTPDNSLAFLRHAALLEADSLEADIRMNAEGHLILAHDEGEADPVLLSDAFRYLGDHGKQSLNCDLKTRGLELAVWELAVEYGMDTRLIFSGSISFDVFEANPWLSRKTNVYLNVEEAIPGIYRQAYSMDNSDCRQIASLLAKLVARLHARCININYRLCRPLFLEELRRYGLAVSAWTVNEEADMKALLDEGVYNITTRNPAAALRLRGNRVREV